MDFRIERGGLFRGLRLACGIGDRNNTSPRLDNLLIRAANEDRVVFATTDLNLTLMVNAPAKVAEKGGVVVGARQVCQIIEGLGGGEVRLRGSGPNGLHIESGRMESDLVGTSERDFPGLPAVEKVRCAAIQASVLAEMIAKASISIPQREDRPQLANVLFESDGKTASMVSTDGRRLSKVSRAIPDGPTLATGVLLPREGVVEIGRILEGCAGLCELGVEHGLVVVKVEDVVFSAKLGDGSFPAYDQVVPRGNDNKLIVEREEFLASLRWASAINVQQTRGIWMSIETGRLVLEAGDMDVGSTKARLAVSYQGRDLRIGFNAQYFIDLLAQMSAQQVSIELGGDTDPILVKECGGPDYFGVIMPVRANQTTGDSRTTSTATSAKEVPEPHWAGRPTRPDRNCPNYAGGRCVIRGHEDTGTCSLEAGTYQSCAVYAMFGRRWA